MPIMENDQLEIKNQDLDAVDDKIKIELMTQSINKIFRQEMKFYATRRQQLRSNRSQNSIQYGVSVLKHYSRK